MELSELEKLLLDEEELLSEEKLKKLYYNIMCFSHEFNNAPLYLKQKSEFVVFCLYLNHDVAYELNKGHFDDENILRTLVTFNSEDFFKHVPNGDEKIIPRMNHFFRKKYETNNKPLRY
jgi:hypothetical protein